jgi:hypothetical protein
MEEDREGTMRVGFGKANWKIKRQKFQIQKYEKR